MDSLLESPRPRRATLIGLDAILPLSDPMALDNAALVGKLSMQWRKPVISPFHEITKAGGLLGYGPDLSTLFRRSAAMVDQIIKGTKPGNISIGQPQKYDLSINLNAAHLFGLSIPATLTSRANHIVQ